MRTEITNEESSGSPREGRRDKKVVQRSEVYKKSEVTDETGLTKRDVYKRTDETDESGRTRTAISSSSTTDGGPAALPPASGAPASKPQPADAAASATPAQPPSADAPLSNGAPPEDLVAPPAQAAAPPPEKPEMTADSLKALAAVLDEVYGSDPAPVANGPQKQEPLANGAPAEDMVAAPAAASAAAAEKPELNPEALKALAAALDEVYSS